MFGNLFKSKLEIEERVRKLQNNYIEAIKFQKLSNTEEDQAAKNKIIEKQKLLSKISTEYKAAIDSCEQLGSLISEQKETALEIQDLVKCMLSNLNIEIPEELEEELKSQLSDDDKEEENNDSDKENSKVEIAAKALHQEEYFSPKIQIRKSLAIDDVTKSYTPAIKSNSKRFGC